MHLQKGEDERTLLMSESEVLKDEISNFSSSGPRKRLPVPSTQLMSLQESYCESYD